MYFSVRFLYPLSKYITLTMQVLKNWSMPSVCLWTCVMSVVAGGNFPCQLMQLFNYLKSKRVKSEQGAISLSV